MKIYIASSFKNRHGVEMLTALLREQGHKVPSWIENCDAEGMPNFNFEEWIKTDNAQHCFMYDTSAATTCDLFIYYAPAGKDACAEMGAAWAKGIPILGLHARNEDIGLMRKMAFDWYSNFKSLLRAVHHFDKHILPLTTKNTDQLVQ